MQDRGNLCTLRAAIEQANANGADNTINVPPGTYFLSPVLGRIVGSRSSENTSLQIIGPSTVVETIVGNVTLTFPDGNHATFNYTVNGVTQTKAITRQMFVTPGTACN